MPDRPTHGAPIADEHIARIKSALDDAGLGGLKIASIQLAAPDRDDDGEQNCHTEQTPDGNFTIVCD